MFKTSESLAVSRGEILAITKLAASQQTWYKIISQWVK